MTKQAKKEILRSNLNANLISKVRYERELVALDNEGSQEKKDRLRSMFNAGCMSKVRYEMKLAAL